LVETAEPGSTEPASNQLVSTRTIPFFEEMKMSARVSHLDPAVADGKAKELLGIVKSKFGTIPNALKTMALAPSVLEGYLALNNALSKGVLSALIREQIALVVSQTNGCDYCLSAHSLTGKLAGLQPDQILSARRGIGTDTKAQAAVTLAQQIVERRGSVSDEDLVDARSGGLDDAEIVEVVGNVAVMTLTNFLNNVAHTDIDFPKVSAKL
jgi:uncharacterized peroxidase-related enzyme